MYHLAICELICEWGTALHMYLFYQLHGCMIGIRVDHRCILLHERAKDQSQGLKDSRRGQKLGKLGGGWLIRSSVITRIPDKVFTVFGEKSSESGESVKNSILGSWRLGKSLLRVLSPK